MHDKKAKKIFNATWCPFNSEYENAGFKLVAISVASVFATVLIQR